MKLNELIERLQDYQKQGHGEMNVIISCYGEEYEPEPELFEDGIII